MMDSDCFFGFDPSIPVDEEELEDDDYNALNDETFGSAAVGGDWEEKHEQLSSLTQAEKLSRSLGKDEDSFNVSDISQHLEELRKSDGSHCGFENISSEKRLFDLSISPSPLFDIKKEELSTSPGSSIWSPTLGVDAVEGAKLISRQRYSSPNHLNSFSSSHTHSALIAPSNSLELTLGMSGKELLRSVKTVSELEEELKFPNRQRQNHTLHSQSGSFNGSPFSPSMQAENNGRFVGNRSPPQKFAYPPPHSHPLMSTPLPNRSTPPGFLHSPPSMHDPSPPFNNHNHRFHQRGPASNHTDHQQAFMEGNNHHARNVNRYGGDKRNFDRDMRYEQQQQRNLHDAGRNCSNNSHGGTNRVRRDSDAEWEEWQRNRDVDEYCGLMTPRDKSWLRNIQSMQLQTDNPYQDDYYCVMHNVRQQSKREENVIRMDGLRLLLGDKGREGKEYEPPRLEKSLGKLKVASVIAPRKIIDLHVVHLDSSLPETSMQKDMRKHRHLLFSVEKLYTVQMELDDLERKIGALPDCPTRDLFRLKCRKLVAQMWQDITTPHKSFVQLLCIRKGKTLLVRFLPWVGPSDVEHVLATVVQNLALLTKKDSVDDRLAMLWPIAERFFVACPVATLLSFGIMMGVGLKSNKKVFAVAASSSFGVSLLLVLLVCGEKNWNELENDDTWKEFVKEVVMALSEAECTAENQVRPLASVTLAANASDPEAQIIKCEDVDKALKKKALHLLENYRQ